MADSRKFTPKNIQKYAGDIRTLKAKSTWEFAFMQKLDTLINVSQWIYEPRHLNILYIDPLENARRLYIPDFLVQYVTGEREIIEIKPMQFAHEGAAKSVMAKIELARNIAKWDAATGVAQSIGAKFIVLTEKQLFARKTARKPRATRSTVKTRGTV
jgi:hypothetical protein